MDDAIRQEIEGLGKLKAKALRVRYRELFDEQSRSGNRTYLFRKLAWRLQAQAEGGLSERAQERARQLAEEAALRQRPPRQFLQELGEPSVAPQPLLEPNLARDRRLPPAGSNLQRAYQGRSIEVRVLQRGFEYNGKRYNSLSAVAHQATGTR
jgi:Protein of unknown function (DUF2924)